MPEFIVLLPVLILACGAIVSALTPALAEPNRRWLTIGILALALIAILMNAAPFSHQFKISVWEAAAFTLGVSLDGIALVLLVAIILPLMALQLAAPRATQDAFSFFVLTTAVLLICGGNLTTTLCAWAFLDLALFAWRKARRIPHAAAVRALVLGQLAGLALFAGAILLDAKQTQTGAGLIALAFWARLGLYPFHWIYPNPDLQTLELAAIRGAALAAGASLWLRWSELNANVPSELIGALAGLTFLVVIVRLASEREALDKIAANASNAIAFVPLAIAFGRDAATALAFMVALGVVFGLAMFELGLVWQSNLQPRWARLFNAAGILSIGGLPLTPAFLGRHGALLSLIENGAWLVFFLSAFAATLAPVPLWRMSARLRGAQAREPTRIEYLGLQLLGLAFIVFGFGAGILAQVTGDSSERALDHVIRTDDLVATGLAFSALIASIAISFLLARVNWGYLPQGEQVARWAGRVIELDWLGSWLARCGRGGSELAKSLTALAEENPTVWILFAALWIAIFILTTR